MAHANNKIKQIKRKLGWYTAKYKGIIEIIIYHEQTQLFFRAGFSEEYKESDFTDISDQPLNIWT